MPVSGRQTAALDDRDGRFDLGLVADIGATHARFALVDEDGRPGPVTVLVTADYQGLEDAIGTFLKLRDRGKPHGGRLRAAVGLAAPVTGDRVTMTNHPWTFSIAEVRRRTGLERLTVVNDLEAVALALPDLPDEAYEVIGAAAPVARGPKAVLGLGTGFGAAYLVPTGPGDPLAWRAFASEAGHATLAAHDAFEEALLGRLCNRPEAPTIEQALSGPGLVNLYRALATETANMGDPPPRTPQAVVAAVKSGHDGVAARTLQVFSALLGGVAGDLALCYGARGGIYLTGGVLAHMGALFDRTVFRARFDDRGQMRAYLAGVPTYLIRTEYPALVGLARLVRNSSGINS